MSVAFLKIKPGFSKIMHPTKHSTPTAAKSQPTDPTQAAVCVSAHDGRNKIKKIVDFFKKNILSEKKYI